MTQKRSRSVLGTIGLLVVAGLLYFARSQGWIDLPEEGSVQAAEEVAGPRAEVERRAEPPTAKPEATSEVADAESGDASGVSDATSGADRIVEWFRAERSGLMVETPGVVKATLPDDDDGSRHQRFILRLSNGHTVLVAHNIDLAPRVPLERGDSVEILGQYEWNEQGGVLHWTHHDPRGRHEDGWIRHDGRVYK